MLYVARRLHFSRFSMSQEPNNASMSSSEQDLFDVFSFEAETRRLRETRRFTQQTPFSHVRVPSQHASDDQDDEDDMVGDWEDEGIAENHQQDLDVDEAVTDGATTLVNMHESQQSQITASSQSRPLPGNYF